MGKWVKHFCPGLPTTGALSQEWVSTSSGKTPHATPLTALWWAPATRFRQRARASGFRNADALVADAMGEVAQGWLIVPPEFSENGDIPFFSLCGTDASFRFGVSQGGKLRACADLRRSMANLRSVDPTPITRAAWGHLSQMAKSIHTTKPDLSSLKGDRASAYKQLPLGPKYARLTSVARRHPQMGRRMGFLPTVLLYGAASAFIHYN